MTHSGHLEEERDWR